MKFKFDCIFYYVSDIERSIRFYSDVLGLKVQSQDFVARFDADGVLFELVPSTDKTKVGSGGNARLCLQVESLDATLRELKQKNVRVEQPKSEHGGRLGSFYDPDGNEICLWEYAKS